MNDRQDKKIIEMFQSRDEGAIRETEKKYRGFCISVLSNFLSLKEDREECMNDAMLALWNSIPPEDPKSLSGYLAKILRNLAVSRTRRENAWKRGRSVQTVNEEFLADLSDGRTLAEDYESALAGRMINEFLSELTKTQRRIFVLRYWYDEDITRIAEQTGKSVGSVKVMLKRLRDRLGAKLKKEGIIHE